MIRIYDSEELSAREILDRDPAPSREAEAVVAEIIAQVRMKRYWNIAGDSIKMSWTASRFRSGR